MIRAVGAADLRRNLAKKGFREAEGNRDHEMFFLWVGEQKTRLWVKLSRGAREIQQGEIRMNARSVKLTGDDLYKILNCEHDGDKTKQLYEQSQAAQPS